jgi:hypothetical protein
MSTTALTAEIIPAPPAPAAALTTTARATIMRASMEADREQRQLIKEYVKGAMVEGTDYGTIPGTPKPTLLKPGAEKLVDLFRCEPNFTVVQRVEDWDKNLFHYEIKCELRSRETGFVFAQGLGSCNSREGRYRWRKADRTCPECGSNAIIKGKQEYGGGWLCFKNKGGCGAKFKDTDPVIVDQPMGKVENDDIASQVNTILKMAKKRALVDASIAISRCSDLFTQGLEDDEPREPVQARHRESRPAQRETWSPAVDPELDPEDYIIKANGKNKDKPLRDLGIPQLEWYADNSKDRELKMYAAAVLAGRIANSPKHPDPEAGPDGWGLSGRDDGHDEMGKP